MCSLKQAQVIYDYEKSCSSQAMEYYAVVKENKVLVHAVQGKTNPR